MKTLYEVLVKNNLKHNNNFERTIFGSKEYEELFDSPTPLSTLWDLDLPISNKSFIDFINEVDEYVKSKNMDMYQIITDNVKSKDTDLKFSGDVWDKFCRTTINRLKNNVDEIDLSLTFIKVLDISCNIVLSNKEDFKKVTCNCANLLLEHICYYYINKHNYK